MSGASRCLLACSNFLTFLVSLPVIASVMIIHFSSHTSCSHHLQQPLFVIGIVLFVVSILGMIGSCYRITFMLWFYQWLMFLLIFVLLCFTVLAVVEVHSGIGKGNGCCKPPAHCGYKLKNGTIWTVPSSGLASRDHDCIMWSSEPNTLCYDCESCKAGVLLRIQEDWWRLSIIAGCLIAFLVINFMVGCCAFRSSQAFDKYQRCRYKS
ncbi:hypothetical protein PVL29_018815 [Vitis rotundifolia]|uniref:Tetraspanin-8 n=1 Tax=Vitis rotundifolia TaxID=103349 RepID=A0AA39DGC2_VITRO|nr:hypothetical protein PVL29_018815 [Vitis rotundifolia]